MPNAVFTASENTDYDDRIEDRYHFPESYLRQVKAAVGDWVLYYEPRRSTGPNKQCYFAMAQVRSVEPDLQRPGHYYAKMGGFIRFLNAIPFRVGEYYYEAKLRKADGSTNKGAFGRAVREIPQQELINIVQAGMRAERLPWEDEISLDTPEPQIITPELNEPPAEYKPRDVVATLVNRKVRDAAFRRQVRDAYQNRCAVTGLKLINGGGRPEVQAAHIRPVEQNGPDTVRNGVALTGTAHWLFDRGLITFSDDHKIILSPHGVPDDMDRLIVPDRKLQGPYDDACKPHPTYLAYHRENIFKQ